jgi:hypothetical protein
MDCVVETVQLYKKPKMKVVYLGDAFVALFLKQRRHNGLRELSMDPLTGAQRLERVA